MEENVLLYLDPIIVGILAVQTGPHVVDERDLIACGRSPQSDDKQLQRLGNRSWSHHVKE